MTDLMTLWRDPAVAVELRTTLTSPFGRKVRIAAEVLDLAPRICIRAADTLDPGDDLRRQNPLGKMPCLMLGTEAFYDSGVILEMFDRIAGGDRLLPSGRAGLDRARVLTAARLADGIAEAALLMVYEGRFREPGQISERWLEHQRGKVLRGLAVFEAAPPAPDRAGLVQIGLACALGYLDWRRPVDWRDGHPGLVRWLAAFAAAVPAFGATERIPA
ncbi:glutathione S-transferase family protein [Frigidibacter sp. MR17.24]|uniref:glutathione S-transferase family protein n=1 Tax=Frigidibacter sp. MR17.24 TaxID=3127345 RepID=UPI0030130427